MALSPEVKAVCARFWRKDRNGHVTEDCCKGCPIMAACHAPIRGALTQASLDDWRAGLHAAAVAVAEKEAE